MEIVSEAAALIRKARNEAGLSQADLGKRLGMSQAAVAKLERTGSNPTVDTLDDVLWATGQRLALTATARRPGVDESLIRQQLELPPGERLRQLDLQIREMSRLVAAGERARERLS
jgi:transcriptional regulator with XRE-family HTH domain